MIKSSKKISLCEKINEPEICLSIEDYNQNDNKQIKDQEWNGNNNEFQKQIVSQRAFGNQIIAGGEYNEKGNKEGLWNEAFCNFSQDNYLIESGMYKDGIRVGKWVINKLLWIRQTQCGKQIMGGGMYNDQGKKDGQWIELHPTFSNHFLLLFEGNYIDNVKNGNWSTKFKSFNENDYRIIGGGAYQNGLKNGNWITICELPGIRRQFHGDGGKYFFQGDYNKGKKQGFWKINSVVIYLGFKRKFDGEQKLMLYPFNDQKNIYDDNGKKQGLWTEIEKQPIDSEEDKLTLLVSMGCYNDDEKDEQWDIILLRNYVIIIKGGGRYNQGKKVGKWKEFELQQDIISEMKVGMSKELYGTKSDIKIWKVKIGNYKEGKKQGLWEDYEIESELQRTNPRIYDNYFRELFYSTRFFGMYNDNGLEEGLWIYLKEDRYYTDSKVRFKIRFKNGMMQKIYDCPLFSKFQ